ncbi:hypothetical protein ANBU17_25470 [Anaerostipes butyraticus]|uniref:Uncharacterized protein n=1 Tax=Anaerostipes butyraticus TaxID=645466 RepID=A0A916VDU7_9FIRM|nr:hypothetical protein ANBU17_25470 [Anaerostipes butyraticus]
MEKRQYKELDTVFTESVLSVFTLWRRNFALFLKVTDGLRIHAFTKK